MLKLGTQNISALYLGGQEIKRAYLGETPVLEEKKTSRLPEGYTEVEYISNPNLGYLTNCGLPTAWTGYRVELKALIPSSTTKGSLLGSYYSANYSAVKNHYDCYLYLNGLNLLCYYTQSTSTATSNSVSLPIVRDTLLSITIDMPAQKFFVNDAFKNLGTNKASSSSTVAALFANNRHYNNGSGWFTKTGDHPINMSLYSLKFTKVSDESIWREYVPCVNAGGVAGVFELVTQKFYSSADSAKPLVAGPAVQ